MKVKKVITGLSVIEGCLSCPFQYGYNYGMGMEHHCNFGSDLESLGFDFKLPKEYIAPDCKLRTINVLAILKINKDKI